MSLDLTGYSPSTFSNILSPNQSGGLQANSLPAPTTQAANPINYGYTSSPPAPTATNTGITSPTPAPTNTGSNGGLDFGSLTKPGGPYAGWTDQAAITADLKAHPEKLVNQPDNADYLNQVDSAFNDVYGSLNDLKNQTIAGKQDYLNSFTSPYDALQPGLDTAYQQGQNLNANQVSSEQQDRQNALASARNLFSELMQGQQQKYGGSSSTGEFAQAFLGRGLQQQMGGIFSQSDKNLGSLATQLNNLTSQHTANINQLNAQKTAALDQAQAAFNDKLNQIDAQVNAASMAKTQAKLQALSDLRNTASQISATAQAQQNNIQLANLQSASNLRNAIVAYQAYSGNPVPLSALQYMSPNMTGQGGQTQQFGGLQGSVGQTGGRVIGYDGSGNPIYG